MATTKIKRIKKPKKIKMGDVMVTFTIKDAKDIVIPEKVARGIERLRNTKFMDHE